MAVFSVNLFRHLYVAKKYHGAYNKTATANATAATTSKTDGIVFATGDIAYKIVNGKLYFVTKTKGGLLRSDLVDLDKIKDARISYGANEATYLKQYTIAFPSGKAPVTGEEYVLGVKIKQYLSIGEEDTYEKVASFEATSTTASDTYKGLALALALNLIKEEKEFVKVFLKTSNSSVEVTEKMALGYEAPSGTFTGIIIKEADQTGDYVRGVASVKPVNFEVFVPELWAAVTNTTPTSGTADKIANGYKVADLEHFCMGERGDEYRMINWPQYIPTEYLVDPTKEYDLLNIHFYYEGDGVLAAKSERDLTIVAEHSSSNNIIDDIAQALVDNGNVTIFKKPAGGTAVTVVTKTAAASA